MSDSVTVWRVDAGVWTLTVWGYGVGQGTDLLGIGNLYTVQVI